MVAQDWVRSARFDIDARADRDAPIAEIRQMLRMLLVERFNMRSHTAITVVDTYDLVVARRDGRLGPRMRPATTICETWNAALAEGKEQLGLRLQPSKGQGIALIVERIERPTPN